MTKFELVERAGLNVQNGNITRVEVKDTAMYYWIGREPNE